MQEQTPIKSFQAHSGPFQYRLNILTDGVSDVSNFTDGLNIYVQNEEEKYCMESTFTRQTLPPGTYHIFGDVYNIFLHISQNLQDEKKVVVVEEGLMICNIHKIKNKEHRQQVILPMTKVPLIKHKEPEEQLNPENKSKVSQILLENKQLRQQFKLLRQEMSKLQKEVVSQRRQKEEMKEEIKQLRQLIYSKGGVEKNIKNGDILGQKVQISIDEDNKNLKNFKIQGNSVQKVVEDDDTRYQILGNQTLGKINRSYFEVKIMKLLNGNFLIGVVSTSRRRFKHSYDQMECLCFDARGKIFDQGKKSPALFKVQSGQTVKVMLDFDESMVRWYVGWTEICSVKVPGNFMRQTKWVPYLELNEKGDKILLNG